MKRFGTLALVLILSGIIFGLSACAPVSNNISFITPWKDAYIGVDYEKTTYEVLRKDANDAVIARGELVCEIESNDTEYTLKQNLTITYLSGEHTGKTDKSVSTTVFTSGNSEIFIPKSSTRVIDYETDPSANLSLSCAFGDGMTITHNYKDGKPYTFSKGQITQSVFDSEQLLLLIRSTSNSLFSTGAQFSYSVVNALDTVYNDRLIILKPTITVGSTTYDVEPIAEFDSSAHIRESEGKAVIPCYGVGINLPGNGSFTLGTEIGAYYSVHPAAGNAQSRLLVKLVQATKDTETRKVVFTTEYNIKSVVNDKE